MKRTNIDDEVKKVVDEIFGEDDYTGLIIGLVFGIGMIVIGLFTLWW